MRAREFLREELLSGFHVYGASVRVKNPAYTTSADVAIFAKNPSNLACDDWIGSSLLVYSSFLVEDKSHSFLNLRY